MMGARFHHKNSLKYQQWLSVRDVLGGTTVIMLADHNSLLIKERDTYHPPKFEQPASLQAREMEVQMLSESDLFDVWIEVHDASSFEGVGTDHELNTSKGFTFASPKAGAALNPQRLRRIDRKHASRHLLHSVTKCFPTFLGGV